MRLVFAKLPPSLHYGATSRRDKRAWRSYCNGAIIRRIVGSRWTGIQLYCRVYPRLRLQFLKWFGWPLKWFRPTEAQANLFWAVVVGCVGGLSAIAFRWAIEGVLWLWTRHTGSLEQVAAQLHWWQRLLIPAGGGLVAGLTLHFGTSMKRRHRSTDYMEAVAVHPGALSVRNSFVKTVSSVLTIGSGGSIGREGAMVQLSAALASWLAEGVKFSTPRLRLMIACGAAGGIAAVYDVNIAAALFVAEIVLGSIAVESLGPLLAASLASSLVSYFVAGGELYFAQEHFKLGSPQELIPYAAMALLLGLAAPAYIWLLRRTEDWLTALVPHVYWRMAVGGLMVGALAIPFPEVWGNGRTMVDFILANPWPWKVLLCILICKVAATAITTGSGAVGGVFTPTLFTGAMLGCLIGKGAQALWHGANPQAFALVGMGGFLAAATRAPLMSMLMVFEMSLDYGVILPLMGVSVIAFYTARSVHSDSIYSESLRRKQPRTTAADISALRVRDVMKPPPQTVSESAAFSKMIELFASAPYRHLPVVSAQNELRGVIALGDVERQLELGESAPEPTAADLMSTEIEMVTADTNLGEALEQFRDYGGEHLPVVNDLRQRVLVGYVSKTDLLLTVSHGLRGSTH